MNIAVDQAMKLDDFDCFIFHDVDLIPENDKNIYECYKQPRHLSPAVDELRYKLVSNMTKKKIVQFLFRYVFSFY